MFVDVVMPKGNESDFIKMAERLGFNRLVFLYDTFKKVEKPNYSAIKGSKNKLSQKADFLFVEAGAENRFFFEKKAIDVIYGLENVEVKDSVHFRKSGINQVLAKLAFEKDIAIGFSLKNIANSKTFGRAMANVRICRKYDVNMRIFSLASSPFQMRAAHDLISFGKVLGMHAFEAKRAISLESFKSKVLINYED